MKDLIKLVVALVFVSLAFLFGKNYYDNQIESPKEINYQEENVEEGFVVETASSVEGFELRLQNKESLLTLLPEIVGNYKVTSPDDGKEYPINTISIELTEVPQEWYRVSLEDSDKYLSSVGVSIENKRLMLKINLSKEDILSLAENDRDWVFNNVTLTALYALEHDWETENLVEQDEIVNRMDTNSDLELPFKIL